MRGTTHSEWKSGWPLLLTSMLGIALSSIPIYSIGLFIQPLEQEFGWSRTQTTLGLTITSITGMLGAPVFGVFVDKWGARRVALPGSIFFCLSFACLSLAVASIWSWWALWGVVALTLLFLKPTAWSAAVSSSFVKSRGMALAIMLSGTGIGSSVTPMLTNSLINQFGWRGAFVALGTILTVIVVPMVWLFFFDSKDRARLKSESGDNVLAMPAAVSGWTVKEGLRSRQFYQISISAMLMTIVSVGLVVHLVPMLSDFGIARSMAASIVGIVGIMSIIGRLTAGYLFDRLPGPPVGMVSVALPLITAALILAFPGSITASIIALIFLGLAIGGGYNASIYLSTRYFGLRKFGSLFGLIASSLLAGTALGPIVAGFLFDISGSYEVFLKAVIPLSILSALMLGTLGKYPKHQISDSSANLSYASSVPSATST